MQVIEKVKVVPEGYNGAGMNYDGGNRRDVAEVLNLVRGKIEASENCKRELSSNSSLFYLSKF